MGLPAPPLRMLIRRYCKRVEPFRRASVYATNAVDTDTGGEPSMPLRVAMLALLSLLALAGCGAISSQGASSQDDTNTPTPKDTLVRRRDDHRESGDGHHRSLEYEPGDRCASPSPTAGGPVSMPSPLTRTAPCWLCKSGRLLVGRHPMSLTCGAQGDPQMVEIKPGSATSVTITAPAAGTYRCALQYTTINIPPPRSAPKRLGYERDTPTSGPGVTVYSAAVGSQERLSGAIRTAAPCPENAMRPTCKH